MLIKYKCRKDIVYVWFEPVMKPEPIFNDEVVSHYVKGRLTCPRLHENKCRHGVCPIYENIPAEATDEELQEMGIE